MPRYMWVAHENEESIALCPCNAGSPLGWIYPNGDWNVRGRVLSPIPAKGGTEAGIAMMEYLGIREVSDWWEATQAAGWPPKPPPMPPKPEQIKDALLKKPKLLWKTLESLLQIKIAGPWTPIENETAAHNLGLSLDDYPTILVRRPPERAADPIVILIKHPDGTASYKFPPRQDWHPADNVEAAKDLADYTLGTSGYLLIPEEGAEQ
jgi:hypothetical protein